MNQQTAEERKLEQDFPELYGVFGDCDLATLYEHITSLESELRILRIAEEAEATPGEVRGVLAAAAELPH